jgi:hypothetical protein
VGRGPVLKKMEGERKKNTFKIRSVGKSKKARDQKKLEKNCQENGRERGERERGERRRGVCTILNANA